MRKVLHVLLFVLACILLVSAACSKSNPVAPSGDGGGGTVLVGDLDIQYERSEEAHNVFLFRPPGTSEGCGTRPPRLNNTPGGWPGGFQIREPGSTQIGAFMKQVSDRVFRYVVKDAPGGELAVSVYDVCRPGHYESGSGFTVNGVRLKDEAYWAHFTHRPGSTPSIIPR